MDTDGFKTEQETETRTENSGDSITLTQDKLNGLINEKYKKGAEKATSELLQSLGVDSIDTLKSVLDAKRQQEEAEKTELQKATEAINSLQSKLDEKDSLLLKLKEDTELSNLAMQHGVKDIEYFKYAYNQEKSKEGFNVDNFVGNLKQNKNYIFNEGVTVPPTDKSGNGQDSPNDLSQKVQGMTLAQLEALQNSL